MPSKEETWTIFQTVLVVLFLPRRTWWLDLPNATPGDRIFLMGSPWESGSNDAITYSAKTHLWHAKGGGSERYPSFKWKAKEDDSKSKLVGHNLESRTKQKMFGNNKSQSCHTLTHWLLFSAVIRRSTQRTFSHISIAQKQGLNTISSDSSWLIRITSQGQFLASINLCKDCQIVNVVSEKKQNRMGYTWLHCCSDAEKKLVGIDDSKKCLKEPRLKIFKVSYSYGYLSCGYLPCRSQSAVKISSTPSNLAISTAKTAVGCRESTLPVVINLVYPHLSDFRVCCKSFIDTS